MRIAFTGLLNSPMLMLPGQVCLPGMGSSSPLPSSTSYEALVSAYDKRNSKGLTTLLFWTTSERGGESIIGWNLDLPRVVASLHANLSESNPRMEFIIIASKRQLPKHQPIIASRPRKAMSPIWHASWITEIQDAQRVPGQKAEESLL